MSEIKNCYYYYYYIIIISIYYVPLSTLRLMLNLLRSLNFFNPIRSRVIGTTNDPGEESFKYQPSPPPTSPPPYYFEEYCINLHSIMHVLLGVFYPNFS